MTNRYGTSSDWVDGDILYSDDLLDSLALLRFHDITRINSDESLLRGVVAHSSTNISVIDTTGEVWQTADSGTTWTSRLSSLDTASFIRLCKADNTRAFAVENTTLGETGITTDSGATWTATTATAYGTQVNDLSYPAAGLIVVAGDDTAGANHIIFSTDSGVTWTDATTQPDEEVDMVDMVDATNGFCVDRSGDIWRTTNGGVTWVDTTFNLTNMDSTRNGTMLAISTSLVIISHNSRISTFNDAAAPVTRINTMGEGVPSSILRKSDGTIYVVALTDASQLSVYRSTDSGVNWKQFVVYANASTAVRITKCMATLMGNDLVISTGGSNLVIIRERSD